MHIPDNYLSPSTVLAFNVMMLPIWRNSYFKVKEEMTRKKIPLIGIFSAFSFLVMMFNIPLPGGTTGHAVGAALIAILLGPYAASIAMTVALGIQAIFFADGGILAFGVNCFNMAFVMPFTAYYIYEGIGKKSPKLETAACFLAGYLSLNLAALLAAIEFGIQPMLFKDVSGLPLYNPYSLNIAIPAIVIPHLIVAGVLEGLVTVWVFRYIVKFSPELIYREEKNEKRRLSYMLGAFVLATPLGLLTSGTAWGEWSPQEIKEDIGFIPKGFLEGVDIWAPIPDYAIPGTGEIFSYLLSAAAGILIIFFMVRMIFRRKLSMEGS